MLKKAKLSTMADTGRAADEAGQSMTEWTGSMKEISIHSGETVEILKTIDEIVFRTNLFALNAAVEAARSGERRGQALPWWRMKAEI